jgi:hypothetical protein
MAITIKSPFVLEQNPGFTGDITLQGFEYVAGAALASAITAHSGGGQASAVTLADQDSIIGTAAANHDSVKLPAFAGVGARGRFFNNTAKIVDLYPQTGGAINGASVNAFYAVPAGAMVFWESTSALNALIAVVPQFVGTSGGDVVGPASAVDSNLVAFDAATGKLIKDSGAAAANVPGSDEKAALGGTSGTPSVTNKYVTDADSRLSDSRAPSGSASGDLGGTYPSPTVSAITESDGPTSLVIGTITDGEYLKRVGSTLVSAPLSATLSGLTDVALASPQVDQLLRYNGSKWVNGASVAVGVGGGIVFYAIKTSIAAKGVENLYSIETLGQSPDTGSEVLDKVTVNASTDVISSFLYPTPLGRTTIDAGVWTFSTYACVDVDAVSTAILKNLMRVRNETVTIETSGTGTSRTATASGGTPFATAAIDASATLGNASFISTPKGLYQITARTSDTEVTIATPTGYDNEVAVAFKTWKKLFQVSTGHITSIAPNYSEFSTTYVAPAFTVLATDAIGELVLATTAATSDIEVSYVHSGNNHYSHVESSLIHRHNELAGKDGGSGNEFYHLTLTEATAVSTLTSDLSGKVPTSRTVSTTAPLTGGGALTSNLTLAISDFVASGASHAKGAVPDPGVTAGTTKFLREDATWAIPAVPSGDVSEDAFSVVTGGAFAAAVTAATTHTQAAATVLAKQDSIVTVAAAHHDGVKFPVFTSAGARGKVYNTTAFAIDLFPSTGGAINGGTANAAVSVPAGAVVLFESTSATDATISTLPGYAVDGSLTIPATTANVTTMNVYGNLDNPAIYAVAGASAGGLAITAYANQSVLSHGLGAYGGVAGGAGVLAANTNVDGLGLSALNTAGGRAVKVEVSGGSVQAAISIVPQAAPSGAHVVGDMYVSTTGRHFLCVVAGTPGTWAPVAMQLLKTVVANQTPVVADTQLAYNNVGTSGDVQITLPASPVAGTTFKIRVTDNFYMKFLANTGQTISVAGNVSASAGYVRSTAVGSVMTLEAQSSTLWMATDFMGTWTIDS